MQLQISSSPISTPPNPNVSRFRCIWERFPVRHLYMGQCMSRRSRMGWWPGPDNLLSISVFPLSIHIPTHTLSHIHTHAHWASPTETRYTAWGSVIFSLFTSFICWLSEGDEPSCSTITIQRLGHGKSDIFQMYFLNNMSVWQYYLLRGQDISNLLEEGWKHKIISKRKKSNWERSAAKQVP